MKLRIVASLFSGALLAALSPAQFTETEPNDTRATANVFNGLVGGNTITGNSIAATGAGLDYFRITTAAAALGIYRHRLVITSATAGHTGTLRGWNQVAAAAGPWTGTVGTAGTTDTALQTSASTTSPARFNQWYGFGRTETVNYRVAGTAATTADYVATYDVQAVTPTHIGSFLAGSIAISTFNQGHTTDTDIWVYDSNLNPIFGYGNDDENAVNGGSPGTGASLQSWLRRDYTNGRYYLALGRFDLSNNQGSPSDDDFRTGGMQEFANVISAGGTTTNANAAFAIIDSAGTNQFASTIAGPYDINWVSFDVVPEPASFAVLGLGAAALLRRRRGKK